MSHCCADDGRTCYLTLTRLSTCQARPGIATPAIRTRHRKYESVTLTRRFISQVHVRAVLMWHLLINANYNVIQRNVHVVLSLHHCCRRRMLWRRVGHELWQLTDLEPADAFHWSDASGGGDCAAVEHGAGWELRATGWGVRLYRLPRRARDTDVRRLQQERRVLLDRYVRVCFYSHTLISKHSSCHCTETTRAFNTYWTVIEQYVHAMAVFRSFFEVRSPVGPACWLDDAWQWHWKRGVRESRRFRCCRRDQHFVG